MTLLIVPLFIAGIGIVSFQQTYGVDVGPCDQPVATPITLAALLANTQDGILNEDNCFTNFRNFSGNADPNLIEVDGTIIGNEIGLMFTDTGGTLHLFAPSQGIGVVFDYDVISFGPDIHDNTLTLDIATAADSLNSVLTRVVVEEQVHDDAGQQNVIAFKDVSLDAAGNSDLTEHKTFAPTPFVSVNVDIGLLTNPQATTADASIEKFTQTFSQVSTIPPLETEKFYTETDKDFEINFFGTLLPIKDDGTQTVSAVIHPKNGKINSYNPGQYYAVTKVTANEHLDNLWIFEDDLDCTDVTEISKMNPKTVPGGAYVALRCGEETIDLSDELAESDALRFHPDGFVEAHVDDVPAGCMVFLGVKYSPGLKGEKADEVDRPFCENWEFVCLRQDGSGSTTNPEDFPDECGSASFRDSAHRVLLVTGLPEVCGNALVEGAEECDEGEANGESTCGCNDSCQFPDTSVVCRTGSGDICDPDEFCDGEGLCPVDGLASAGTLCRPGGDICDPGEVCSGVADEACPADVVESAGTLCRAGSGDACDPDEVCNGISGMCPADVVEFAGTVCDVGSGDACDPDEVCNGSPGAACPADGISPAGTVCREGSGDICDPAEVCSGVADQACPADTVADDGAACGVDGICSVGICEPLCGDGTVDPGEECDGSNLNGMTCETQGFEFGDLSCNSSCSFDTSGCNSE